MISFKDKTTLLEPHKCLFKAMEYINEGAVLVSFKINETKVFYFQSGLYMFK
ncbi:hypothetical protein ABOONEI_977 [Aciduliprofundum boonei T469]|nr:hypothetical protein ABOONEI_977 [Aciduliprofundum boonei T469]